MRLVTIAVVVGVLVGPVPVRAQDSCEFQRATLQTLVGQVGVSREQTEIQLAQARVRLQQALQDVARLQGELDRIKKALPGGPPKE